MNREQTDEDGARLAAWLAELAVALEQAQRVASLMRFAHGRTAESRELGARLGLLREEVESLRSEGQIDLERLPPNWIQSLLESAELIGVSGKPPA